jgi:hypothetical protein
VWCVGCLIGYFGLATTKKKKKRRKQIINKNNEQKYKQNYYVKVK